MKNLALEIAARAITALVLFCCIMIEIFLHLSTTVLYKLHIIRSTWRSK